MKPIHLAIGHGRKERIACGASVANGRCTWTYHVVDCERCLRTKALADDKLNWPEPNWWRP